MITTPAPILEAVSGGLNESTTDTSSKRIIAFNRAMRKFLNYKKFKFAIVEGTLTLVSDTQKYNLLTEFADYDVARGIDEVWIGNDQIFPIDNQDKEIYTETQKFFLTNNGKSIEFTKTLDYDGTNPTIYYYAQHTNIDASTDTLNIPIPEAFQEALVLLVKHFVHDGKRQRNDARNALLDYKDEIKNVAMAEATPNAKHLKKKVVNPLQYRGIRRKYANH